MLKNWEIIWSAKGWISRMKKEGGLQKLKMTNYRNYFYQSKDYNYRMRDLENRFKTKMNKYTIFFNKEQ